MRKKASHIDKTSLLEEQSSEDHPDVRLQSPGGPRQMSESCYLFVLQCLCSLSSALAPRGQITLRCLTLLPPHRRDGSKMFRSLGPAIVLCWLEKKSYSCCTVRAGLANFRYFVFSLSLARNLHINLPSRSNTLSPFFTPPSSVLSRRPCGCNLNTSRFLVFRCIVYVSFFLSDLFTFCNFKNIRFFSPFIFSYTLRSRPWHSLRAGAGPGSADNAFCWAAAYQRYWNKSWGESDPL